VKSLVRVAEASRTLALPLLMGAGTSSSALLVGLYHRIVVTDIGSPLSSEVSVHYYTITSLGLVRRTVLREALRASLRGAEPLSKGITEDA
jgi:hypothetical protein